MWRWHFIAILLFAFMMSVLWLLGMHQWRSLVGKSELVFKAGRFYYGPLRDNGEDILLVAGTVEQFPNTCKGFVWLYGISDGIWELKCREEISDLTPVKLDQVFKVEGDVYRHVSLYIYGVDNIQLCVMRFGRDYKPEMLLDCAMGRSIPPRVEKVGSTYRIVERYTVGELLQLGKLKVPLPNKFRNHIVARRVWIWDCERDKYALQSDWEPDVDYEKSLTAKESEQLRSELSRALKLFREIYNRP